MDEPEIKYIVRVANTDLDGNKAILFAMRKIRGVNVMLANALLSAARIDKTRKAGQLSDSDIQNLNDVVANPVKYNISSWLFNRRKDSETGEDKHLITGDLKFWTETDIKMMKKIRSYKGMRHAFGLPVRGQRTRSNFRKNKGRVSLGVQRKKAQAAAKSQKK